MGEKGKTEKKMNLPNLKKRDKIKMGSKTSGRKEIGKRLLPSKQR